MHFTFCSLTRQTKQRMEKKQRIILNVIFVVFHFSINKTDKSENTPASLSISAISVSSSLISAVHVFTSSRHALLPDWWNPFCDLFLQIGPLLFISEIVLSAVLTDLTAAKRRHSLLFLLLSTPLRWPLNNITSVPCISPTNTSKALSLMFFLPLSPIWLSKELVKRLFAWIFNMHETRCIDRLWLNVGV